MGLGRFQKVITCIAGADLEEYKPVKPGSTDNTVEPAGDNERAFGFTVAAAKTGEPVGIALPGSEAEVKLVSGVGFGKQLRIANSGGELKEASVTGQKVVAISSEAGAAGQIIRAMVTREVY